MQGSQVVAVPANTTVDGSCGSSNSTSQFITMSFYDGWTLKLTFQSDGVAAGLLGANAGNNYHLANADVTYVLNNNIFTDKELEEVGE